MSPLLLVIVILLLLAVVGAFPAWPHSEPWGYGPSSILGTVLVVVLILFLIGRL